MTVAADCYHCGLPIPAGSSFQVEIDGQQREMCCLGCQAVAEAIVAGGHVEYYRRRDTMPDSPREAMPSDLKDLGLFDHPDVQRTFVRPLGEFEREAALILEGITCAACVWLNEAHIAALTGVLGAEVNFATHRARIRWDERKIKLSEILGAVAAIGYRAHPYDVGKQEQLAAKERRSALWRLFVAGFGMMQVMMYAVPVYLADEGTMTPDIELLMRWASLILTLPVVLYSAAPFFRNALRDLRMGRAGMDVPVALGVGAAFVASLWATLAQQGEVYFDSVTMFVFFLLGGRFLEMAARQRAARGVESLAKAVPAFAERLTAYPLMDAERVVAGELRVGDCVLVKPGEGFPADGTILQGHSAADESLLTGESRPVSKSVGDEVTGGSVNVSSPLVIEVRRVGAETRLAAIQRLMEQAARDKPQLVLMADRIAARFVVALILLAIATAVVWYFIDPSRMLLVFVSVLVVSCPCALSLATPTVMTVATGSFAGHGLLVVRGHSIETLAQTTVVAFDKTGTLTHGCLGVVGEHWIVEPSRRDMLSAIVLGMEGQSEHPVAKGLCRYFSAYSAIVPEQVRAVPGIGMVATLNAVEYAVVSLTHASSMTSVIDVPGLVRAWAEAGDTVIALEAAGAVAAYFRLTDTVRESSQPAVEGLNALRVESVLLSGDAPQAARNVASAVGIVTAEGTLSPEGKHSRIKALQAAGGVVTMVGDGVNDAPVLAQAQVSIAMGSGTDLARAQADMVLLGEELTAIPRGIELARKTAHIVRQNLFWAFAYNITAIPLAMTGFITPWMAAIGMSSSSLLVVLNALRLQGARTRS